MKGEEFNNPFVKLLLLLLFGIELVILFVGAILLFGNKFTLLFEPKFLIGFEFEIPI